VGDRPISTDDSTQIHVRIHRYRGLGSEPFERLFFRTGHLVG